MRHSPCPSCGDLVRAEEPTCPFCAASLPRPAKSRVALTGAVVLGASLALAGCEKPPMAPAYGGPPTNTAPQPPEMAAAYGVAMVTASASAPLPPKPPPQTSGSPVAVPPPSPMAPAYGIAPTGPKK